MMGLRLPYVLAGSEHHLGAVQSQRVDADPDLTFPGRRDPDLLDPQDLGAAGLVKAHGSRHGLLLLIAGD
jgi:hypothetical protein